MPDRELFAFKIEPTESVSISAQHFARYIRNLTLLLGSEKTAHLEAFRPDSMVMTFSIPHSNLRATLQKVKDVSQGEGAVRATNAYIDIQQYLHEDKSTARLFHNTEEILYFSGTGQPMRKHDRKRERESLRARREKEEAYSSLAVPQSYHIDSTEDIPILEHFHSLIKDEGVSVFGPRVRFPYPDEPLQLDLEQPIYVFASAWNNGGERYGIKISRQDRNRIFFVSNYNIHLKFPNNATSHTVNLGLWTKHPKLHGKVFRAWFEELGYVKDGRKTWQPGRPPKILITYLGGSVYFLQDLTPKEQHRFMQIKGKSDRSKN